MARILLVIGLFALVQTARLPSYFNLCKEDDPHLKECIIRNGNLAIHDIAKGDIHYDFPSLTPLKLSKPILKKIDDLSVTFTNVEIYGLEKSNITDVDFNLGKGYSSVTIKVPKLIVIGNYLTNSYFYNVPSLKTGRAVRTMDGVTLHLSSTFDTKKIDDEEYFHFLSLKQEYEVEKDTIEFDGLIDETGYFEEQFNDNFGTKTLKSIPEKKGKIDEELGDFITIFFKSLINKVPKDEFFKH